MEREYSKNALLAISKAKRLAKSIGVGYVGTEHILLAILHNKSSVASKVLIENGVTFDKCSTIISQVVSFDGKVSVIDKGGFTPKAKEVLELSKEISASMNAKNVGTEHFVFAIIRDGDNLALRMIDTIGANLLILYSDLLKAIGEDVNNYRELFESIFPKKSTIARKNAGSFVDKYSKDLTAMASAGKLDPVIGREVEIQRVIQTLSRRTKNNPCLVGEPGVGKTAIVEGLARRIVEGSVPETIRDKRLLTLDLSAMVAGSKYRGEFEDRIKRVIAEIIECGNIILFVDELHTLIGAGGSEGSLDASNILKPSLSRGEVQIIGATTYDEYRKYIEKDAALERRFQPLNVEPPSENEAIEILKGIRNAYETHHGVEILDEAIEACVKLSDRYLNDRFLPDKAIDLMDEASSKVRIREISGTIDMDDFRIKLDELEVKKENALCDNDLEIYKRLNEEKAELEKVFNRKLRNYEKQLKNKCIVTADDISNVVAEWTKIPIKKITEGENSRLKRMESTLKKRIIGQDEAVSSVSRAIKRGRVGLKEKNRPIGSFLFLGPTGVGKTELSKALTDVLFGTENALIRVDMSEYMEKHSVSKMIGSPPGYVGFDDGGQLTEKIRRNPYSVVLFDEIEKAHPDVFNVLLQVLDEGNVTDSNGRKVSFKNCVIIMTSNAGASRIVEPKHLGFVTENDENADHTKMKTGVMEEVKKLFKPEFINRIDEIIVFRALNNEDMKRIVDLQIKALIDRATEDAGIELKVADSVKKHIVEKASDKKYGARPLRRAIQTMVEDKIAEAIISGNVKTGDSVKVYMNKNEIIVSNSTKAI